MLAEVVISGMFNFAAISLIQWSGILTPRVPFPRLVSLQTALLFFKVRINVKGPGNFLSHLLISILFGESQLSFIHSMLGAITDNGLSFCCFIVLSLLTASHDIALQPMP